MTAPATPGARGTLRRDISLTAATAIVVGSVVGSGIFRTPSLVAQQYPEAWIILLLWTLGGVVTIAGALTVAELAAMYPASGGPYAFVKAAFGERSGFLAGWVFFLLGKLAVAAAIAVVFAEHASFLAASFTGSGLTPTGVVLLAAWACCALTLVNYLGVKLGAGVNTFLTVLKALSLAGVVAAAFFFDPGTAAVEAPFAGQAGLATALLFVLFAYNSWINATVVGEEVVDPARNLPKALFFGTALVTVLYLGVNGAYLWILGADGMAANRLVATVAMSRVFALGGVFVAGAIMVSTFGAVNANILTGARLPFSMARDGFLPRVFGTLNHKDVPAAALLLELVPMLVMLALLRDFETISAASTFASFVILLAVGVAFFVLRRTHADVSRPYRVHFYPVVPVVFVASSAFVVGITAVQRPENLLVTGIVVALGVGALLVGRGRRTGSDA